MATIQIPLVAGTLPGGAAYCFSNFQQFMVDIMAASHGAYTGQFAFYNIGPGPIDPTLRDFPWLRTGDANWNGWYIWDTGSAAWKRAQRHPFNPGDTMLDTNAYGSGSEADAKVAILSIDLYDGDTANPFWRLADGTLGTPDLRERVLIGAGAGAGLTNRAAGVTGGEETHILLTAEMPAHTHTYNRPVIDQNPGPVADVQNTKTVAAASTTGSTGGDVAHNNMQPFRTGWMRVRTSRVY